MNAKGVEEQTRTMTQNWDETDLADYFRYDKWTPEMACRILAQSLASCFSQNKKAPYGFARKRTREEKAMQATETRLRKWWLSRGDIAPYEKHPPTIYIEWALLKDFRPDWLDWAIGRGLYTPKQGEGALATVNQAATAEAKAKVGRPKTIDKKANAVRQIIECFEKSANRKFDSSALPGSAADLLGACQRLEKGKTNKKMVFSASNDAFNTWLKAAGYGFSPGRTPDNESNYWTRLCVQTMAIITPEVFTGVNSKAKP